MRGIVGLRLKNAELHPRLGEPLVPMLDGISSRGPHSAGLALHDGDGLRLSKTLYSSIGGLMAHARAMSVRRTWTSRRFTRKRRRVVLLTPTELERLTIFTAAELARKRRERGLKLNHPEAVAIIVDEVMEKAREGKSVAELISYGSTVLTTDDVMPGVAELMPFLQVEPVLKTGTKLVTIHEPIRPGKEKVERVEPGEIATEEGEIEINAGRRSTKVTVVNTGDRPVQVGSHFHFFEANRELEFDREKTFGMHLDVPAGTAKRFAPGEHVEVTLVEFGGTGEVWGLNNLTNGSIRSELTKKLAIERAHQHGFKGA